jgi:hypothetical protein
MLCSLNICIKLQRIEQINLANNNKNNTYLKDAIEGVNETGLFNATRKRELHFWLNKLFRIEKVKS